jgi:type I restriction enzyme, S subunit
MTRWPLTPLAGHISEVTIRKGDSEAEILSVTNNRGFVRSLEVFDKQVFSEDASNYKLVRYNDLAYNPSRINVGSVARCTFREGGSVSPMYVVVRCKPSLLPQYLLYFLKSDIGRRHITHRSVGAVRSQLRFKDLEQIEVPLPPVVEQERIVRILDEADKLGRLRTGADAGTRNLISSLFSDMFNRSQGWPVETLSTLCDRVTVGYVGPMTTEYIEAGIPFLRGQNIKRGYIDLTDVIYVSHEFHRRLEKSAIRPRDVVSVRTGKPGTTAVVPEAIKVANCADLIVMTCGPRLNPFYLCELLNQRLGDVDKISGAVGIAQQHFNIGEARRLNIVVPPLSMQNEYERRVGRIRLLQELQSVSREQLETLTQSLLNRAFMGDL